MKSKIILGLGAAGTALAMLPLFAAFEAHVVNVTARIENALEVPVDEIEFGTVFPQEHLEQELEILLSQSFLDEDRVDDVEYFIRQKPKCGVTTANGQVLVGPTATGHVIPTPDDLTTSIDESNEGTAYTIDCGPAPKQLETGESWGVLPSLCEYLSKDGDDPRVDPDGDNNDGTLPSFHKPFVVSGGQVQWLDVFGRLFKGDENDDVSDTWVIDLAVPCFGGQCAQDWADFVHEHNQDADPDDYVQDIANEHKVFGCDLWVEVSRVSEKLRNNEG